MRVQTTCSSRGTQRATRRHTWNGSFRVTQNGTRREQVSVTIRQVRTGTFRTHSSATILQVRTGTCRATVSADPSASPHRNLIHDFLANHAADLLRHASHDFFGNHPADRDRAVLPNHFRLKRRAGNLPFHDLRAPGVLRGIESARHAGILGKARARASAEARELERGVKHLPRNPFAANLADAAIRRHRPHHRVAPLLVDRFRYRPQHRAAAFPLDRFHDGPLHHAAAFPRGLLPHRPPHLVAAIAIAHLPDWPLHSVPFFPFGTVDNLPADLVLLVAIGCLHHVAIARFLDVVVDRLVDGAASRVLLRFLDRIVDGAIARLPFGAVRGVATGLAAAFRGAAGVAGRPAVALRVCDVGRPARDQRLPSLRRRTMRVSCLVPSNSVRRGVSLLDWRSVGPRKTAAFIMSSRQTVRQLSNEPSVEFSSPSVSNVDCATMIDPADWRTGVQLAGPPKNAC